MKLPWLRTFDPWCVALLMGLVLATWAPRFRGPIDLRYDAGVYYILGTSLAEGKGYRLLNEPGSIEAIQYPPALPAVVAIHQWALGTSDPDVIGRALRGTYIVLSMLYAIATYVLARQFFRGGPALIVAAITSLHPMTVFLSDLLFAEIPFALVTILFVLSNRRSSQTILSVPTALLGAIAFLLRSAGIALLAAWVMESLIGRRWAQAAARAVASAVVFFAWQGYVGGVRSSVSYQNPAYAYQRAPYQYYNVSYGENLMLVDSFDPAQGRLTPGLLAGRVLGNAASMPAVLGRFVVGDVKLREVLTRLGTGHGWGPRLADLIQSALGALFIAGAVLLLVKDRDRLIPVYLAGSFALICLTPWPEQYNRYANPLFPFLALCLLRALTSLASWTRTHWAGVGKWSGTAFATAVLVATLVREATTVVEIFATHRKPVGRSIEGKSDDRLIYYDQSWSEFDRALAWLQTRAEPDAVVGSSAPHWVYVTSGLPAVLPPMEDDPTVAQPLLDSVPVSYLIADRLPHIDVIRPYVVPVIERYPERWEQIYAVPGGQTIIYRRVEPAGEAGTR